MEYSYDTALLENKQPEISCSLINVEVKEKYCSKEANLSYGCLLNNDVYDSCYSNFDERFSGFKTPTKDKYNYILGLMKKIENEINEDIFAEKDVIDGIQFLSFTTEKELMDYAKTQMQDLRANASDDGLEILDDGTFSNISSNHAIVPTKTKDITRIKGWRNKHFAGINTCDDSGGSLRNDDDGFGDDLEIKSVQDESSEELESLGYAASTTSKSGFEGELANLNEYKRIDSPIIEDSNAVDNAEVFSLSKSSKKLPKDSSSSTNKKPNSSGSISDFSFDHFGLKGIFTTDKLSDIIETPVHRLEKNITDTFLLPITPDDRKSKMSLESQIIYKSRVKQDFIAMLEKKVSANNLHEKSIPVLVSPNRIEKGIRWRVPKEKILSGNIYDVEVSTDCDQNLLDCKMTDCGDPTLMHSPRPCTRERTENCSTMHGTHTKSTKDNIAAFVSTTLDNYTTYLNELHIDFTIPKLKAADNVTHEEIVLPIQVNTSTVQKKQRPKHCDGIRAKTVAEKRKLLTENAFNQRSKRIPKMSFKIRDNNKIMNDCKKINSFKENLKKNGQDAKCSDEKQLLFKKSQTSKSLFDIQGVITYGREKPLKSVFRKSLVGINKPNLSCKLDESSESSPGISKIGMILNIGMFRPLFKEAYDNVKRFAFDVEGNITAEYAAFSSSALQNSQSPFTVKRILVPVVDETLQNLMYISRNIRQISKRKNSLVEGGNSKPLLDINLVSEDEDLEIVSKETKQFVIHNQINDDVFNVVSDMIRYVDRKESFENASYKHDPDVPVSYEKQYSESPTLKTSDKQKKTKLQRQIERLGGTFIDVQGEEGNEDSLAKSLQENTNCVKESCKMGCVCPYRMLRVEHCGKECCIFACQCPPFARKQECEIKSKIWLLPEVLRHHNVSQSKLAPVEREYHQTVIMSKDKKITIETKQRKRVRKLPSKYKDEILFDYKKDIDGDNDITFILAKEEKDKKAKPNCQGDLPVIATKFLSKPIITPLKTFLKKPTIVHQDLKLCSVQIESNKMINRMAEELSNVSILKDTMNNPISRKRKNSEVKIRNVARKRTGYSTSHKFDVENLCSRTFGVDDSYALRNYLGKLRTKNFMLYPMFQEDTNSVFLESPPDNANIIKEDLVEITSADSEIENEIEEKNPNEEERGLQIEFVHSIPPHLFENQDEGNHTKKTDNCNAINYEEVSESPNIILNASKEMTNDTNIAMQDIFFYAALPKTENECKWWVVELDYNKFTSLIYYSEKMALSIPLIKKAIFDAQFNNTTIKIVLQNINSPFKDKFGAYLVGGFYHLIFFGPYEPSETHGITAIKQENEKFIQVPFTTKNTKNEHFKPLGVNMIPMNGESSQSILNAVNAVWLFSTGKKGTLKNVAESRSVQTKIFNLPSENHKNSSSIATEEDVTSGIENDFKTVKIVDDITIEQDPLKFEPIDCYEGNISCNPTSENKTDTNTLNNTIDCLINDTDNNHEKNIDNIGTDEDSALDTGNPVNISGVIPFPVNNESRLKRNIAKMKTSAVHKSKISSVKNDNVMMRRRKKKHQKQVLKTDNFVSHIVSLKKKIENLNNIKETIISKKVETREESLGNISEIDVESDSSLSDEDINMDGLPEKTSIPPSPTANVSKRRRIVHKYPKAVPKSNAPGKCILPEGLLQSKEKEGPCPEKALLCLTPGIGYIPVLEFNPRSGHIVIEDPASPMLERMFSNRDLAVDWLNKFFRNVFLFNPTFEMQWVIMHGSIIRKLLPLNKDIFKYNNRSLTIRPSGLVMEHNTETDQDLVDWERRELSSLQKRISSRRTRERGISDINDHNKREQMRRSELAKLRRTRERGISDINDHNKREQMRRSELAKLFSRLGRLVYPVENPAKLSKVGVLRRAKLMCDAQKIIQETMSKEDAKLKKKRDDLKERLKSIFTDILDPKEKRRALGICKSIRGEQYKLQGVRDKYLTVMCGRENDLVRTMSSSSKYAEMFRSSSTLSISSSSSGSMNSADVATPGVDQQHRPVGKKPTEGVLVKTKLRSLAAKRPHLKIFPASPEVEVINLVESDHEELTIEIESEEEDVIWLPPKGQSQPKDADVEIISANIKPKRQMLLFPRPMKTLKQPQLKENSTTILNMNTPADGPAPVALVMSPAVMEQHRLVAEAGTSKTVPEFVAVDDHDYQPLFCEFESGCSRTDPVPDKYRAKPKLAHQTFIPLHQASLNNSINITPNSLGPANPPNTTNSTIQLTKLPCQFTTFGGKSYIGKQVLLRKSEKGIQISKLPKTLPLVPHLTPLSATPVTITEASGSFIPVKVVPPNREDTVTLHHPVEGISVTKMVKFANISSGQVDMDSPSLKSGPKIRIPKDDFIPSPGIKVLLPKRK